jgi:hypothetical protein
MTDVLLYLQSLLDRLGSIVDLASAVKTGLGVALGAIITATVYHRAAKQQRENLLRTHDFEVLSALTQSSSQAAAYSKVVRFIATRSEPEIPMALVAGNEELEEQVLVMLGMYQFLAFAVKQGLVDKHLVCRQFLPSMKSLVFRLRPFIEHYRLALNRPAAWSELEEFVRENG